MCRAKFGETAFLEIYQTLYEAPDPAPSLAHALVHFTPSFYLNFHEFYSFPEVSFPVSTHVLSLQFCCTSPCSYYAPLLSTLSMISQSKRIGAGVGVPQCRSPSTDV
jgi:hypothetical protein